jgi:5-methylthioribose kinase
VKQALPRLRVAEEWLATPQRIAREAAAIDLAGSICPGSVPRVVYLDLASHLLVMTRAARQARTWKADLLAGRIDRAVAERAGQLIGRWHAVTAADPDLVTAFSDTEAFVQLRIDPYHRTVASRHPQLAGRIEELAAGLLDRPQCLVHGDLSPKNVLVDVEDRLAEVGTAVQTGADAEADAGVAHQIWLIDWEVAHLGNPIFDLAFVLCHLRCKAARCPADAGRLAESAGAFLGAYQAEAAAVWATVDEGELAAQTACLLLARVDGKSPVEYLDPPAQQLVRQVAVGLLRAGNPGLDAIFAA